MQVREQPVIWLQGAGCSGCSISLMNSVSPSIRNLLLDEIVPGQHINLLFHPTLMAASGELAIEVMLDRDRKTDYLLVLEGSIPTAEGGIFATVGEEKGKPVTLYSRFKELARRAIAVVAVGTCASFGGIPAAKPNPTGSKSAGEVLEEENISVPYINIPGCPPHPDWFIGTIADILLNGIPSSEKLDDLKRPKFIYGKLIHENCPRRPFFDEGKFAHNFGEEGCLYELGCKGPFTYSDCPIRHWNGGVNWPVDAGAPCNGCTEPIFPDISGPFYQKISRWDSFKVKVQSDKER
ncbi:hydrogenase small subunit [Candidatus Aerophobetes bacterium]|nr:hydrogenase small subunit [Candidatus Aerophobetes bacterium]